MGDLNRMGCRWIGLIILLIFILSERPYQTCAQSSSSSSSTGNAAANNTSSTVDTSGAAFNTSSSSSSAISSTTDPFANSSSTAGSSSSSSTTTVILSSSSSTGLSSSSSSAMSSSAYVFNGTITGRYVYDCLNNDGYINSIGVCTCAPGWMIRGGQPLPANATKICDLCPAGTISTSDDALACTNCGAGRYSALGDSFCTACSLNTYNTQPASTSCSFCPYHSSTLNQAGSAACFCDPGYVASYPNSTLLCSPCPNGAECTSTLGVAKSKPGWWYDPETAQYYQCPENYCCDLHNGTGCSASDSYACYPNRHGFLCGDCDLGYSSIGGGKCISCSGPNGALLFVLILVGIIFLVLCLVENPSEDASTKLIVDYIQMCALILNPNIGIEDVLSLVHLELGSATAKFNSCILPLPPILGISASSLIPFLLFAILGAIHLLHYLIAHYCKSETWLSWYEANRWRYTNCAWEIVLFGFMAIVSACVRLLDCQHVGNHYVLTQAPSVECFTGPHFGVAVIALVLFCVFTFVVPIWLVSLLSELSKTTERRSSVFLHSMRQIKQLKKDYKKQRKMMLKQSKSGGSGASNIDQKIMDINEYLQNQMQQTKKVTRTGHEIALWCYHADKYWCEAAFLLRRVIFTLITVLLIREKAAMLITWFCLIILVIHARFPVFRKQSSSYFHDCCLGAIAAQSALNLDIYAADPTGHVDFSSPSTQAEVVVIYAVVIMPVIIGLGLFIKEFLKERIRKKHAIVKNKKPGEEDDHDGGSEEEEEEDDDDDDDDESIDSPQSSPDGPNGIASPTNSMMGASTRNHRHSMAMELTQGVLRQGPNVSTRSYNNAPIDLDAVLASQTGAVISTPQFPNHQHPPVTIHF